MSENSEREIEERDYKIRLLEAFGLFLEEHGYTDIDWRTEPPYAIDEFLKEWQSKATQFEGQEQ